MVNKIELRSGNNFLDIMNFLSLILGPLRILTLVPEKNFFLLEKWDKKILYTFLFNEDAFNPLQGWRSRTQCLKITKKILIRLGMTQQLGVNIGVSLVLLGHTNETFLQIFKHCAYLTRRNDLQKHPSRRRSLYTFWEFSTSLFFCSETLPFSTTWCQASRVVRKCKN